MEIKNKTELKKVTIKNWSIYEVVWLLCFTVVALILTIISGDSWFGFSVFITGVFCVVLAAKGNILTYVFGMYNAIGYAFVAWQNNLFGEMGLNLFFFVPMNILGYIMWNRHTSGASVSMRGLTKRGCIWIVIICVTLITLLWACLSQIPNQNSALMDAITNILSIIATVLMVLRYKEQWVLYIILNVFTIIMWSIRLLNGSPEGEMMIVMWSAYLINAIYGYRNWSKGSIDKTNEVKV